MKTPKYETVDMRTFFTFIKGYPHKMSVEYNVDVFPCVIKYKDLEQDSLVIGIITVSGEDEAHQDHKYELIKSQKAGKLL